MVASRAYSGLPYRWCSRSQNAPRCRPPQGLMRLIDLDQQLDVCPAVALRETPPQIHARLHLPARYITANQPRHLRTAQPGNLLHVTPQKTPRNLPLPGILLLNKHPLYPAVDLPPIMALKPDSRAGPDEPANLLQTQLLCFVHPDVQSPACLPLQAHLVLESTPPFRLILYWTRLTLVKSHSFPYT